MIDRFKVLIKFINVEAPGIRSFELTEPRDQKLPQFSAGAHVTVHLPNGLQRQYSLLNDPSETRRYVIGVLRNEGGRGGSIFLHDQVKVGDELMLSGPRNLFPLTEGAKRYVLVAGGIGITPILAMMHSLEHRRAEYQLHYFTSSIERTPFKALLQMAPFAHNLKIYHSNEGEKPPRLPSLLRSIHDDAHLYYCGPDPLMHEIGNLTKNWPADRVHFERFSAEAPIVDREDSIFSLFLARSAKKLIVPVGKTILEVLTENGIDVNYSCTEGTCGVCAQRVLAGEADHRDGVLSRADRDEARLMTVCCSRSKTPSLTLDL